MSHNNTELLPTDYSAARSYNKNYKNQNIYIIPNSNVGVLTHCESVALRRSFVENKAEMKSMMDKKFCD